MELRNYLMILWRRKWVVILVTATTLIVVVGGTLKMTPVYQASTTLRVATAAQGSVDSVQYATTYADRLMTTYAKMATSGPILERLNEKLGIAKAPKASVNLAANSELMQITVEDPDPILAAQGANALADLLISNVRNSDLANEQSTEQMLNQQVTQYETELNEARQEYESAVVQNSQDRNKIDAANQTLQVKQQAFANLLALRERILATRGVRSTPISVVEPAVVSETPTSPRKELNFALGSLIGLLGGAGLAFLFENFDSTLYTSEQIRKATELPILGRIPIAEWKKGHYFFNRTSPEGEAFRHFRTSILSLDKKVSPHSLLITSAEPGEGKSTVAANLAYFLTQAGLKVILVDCDLRCPAMHKIFNIPNRQGLSNILSKELCIDEALQFDKETGVWLLTSGPLPPNPAELLGSPQMSNLIEQLDFEVILLDAPSLLAVTDAAVLASAVDGVVLVVRRAHARQGAVEAACELLENIKARAIGVVVNRADRCGNYAYCRKPKPYK